VARLLKLRRSQPEAPRAADASAPRLRCGETTTALRFIISENDYMSRTILAVALATLAPAAFAGLPTGLSGAWYDDQHTGHGVHLEMLSPDAAIGAWNVYDPQGNPVHLYLEGHVDGHKLVMQAFAPRGMKFGSFDRSNYSAPRWGLLTLDFADCDHATLAYHGDGPAGAGFGQGTIPLKRLTRIGGLSCSFGEQLAEVPAGAYDGDWGWPAAPFRGDEFRLHAAVDTDGRLWATSTWTPGQTYLSGVGHPPVLIATTPKATADGFEADAIVRYNSGMQRGTGEPPPGGPVSAQVQYRADAAGAAHAKTGSVPGMFDAMAVTRAPGANALDAADFETDSLDGRRFTFVSRGQFFDTTHVIEFGRSRANAGADHICIVDVYRSSQCEFEGHITGVDEGLAMFDFSLDHGIEPGRVYHGKGWLRSDSGELVMVAEGADKGLGFVAEPKD
jgi:hypothetical protein